MIRRDFLKTAGLGSLGAISSGSMFPKPTTGTLNTVPEMKITKIDVVYDFKSRYKEPGDPWFMWVRLYTDNGIVGVGETYWNTEAQVGVLKDKKNDTWP